MNKRYFLMFSGILVLILISIFPIQASAAVDRSSMINDYGYPRDAYSIGANPPFSISEAVDESISPATGNLVIRQTDLALKGKNGLNLEISRYYSLQESNLKEPYVGLVEVDEIVTGYLVEGEVTIETYTIGGTLLSTDYDTYSDATIYEQQQEAADTASAYNSGVYDSVRYQGGYVIHTHFHNFTTSYVEDVEQTEAYGTLPARMTYADSRFDIGAGWFLDFPMIELRGIYQYLHYGSKGTWLIEFTAATDDSNLKDYELKDMVIEPDNGSFTYNSRTSAYILIEKDGRKLYFDEEGCLIGIEDRFGNLIKFQYIVREKTDDDSVSHEFPYISKIVDSASREIDFAYNDENGTITISVEDDSTPAVEKVITYQKEAVDDLINDTGDTREIGEYVLASVTDPEGKVTGYGYDLRYSRNSMLSRNLPHYSDNSVYFEGVYNYYACLTEITYPTGGKTYYGYNTGIVYSAKDQWQQDVKSVNDPDPDLNIKNCGNDGAMYFHKVVDRYELSSDDNHFNEYEYMYKYDNTGQFDGYPAYTGIGDLPSNYSFKTHVSRIDDSYRLYEYNNRLLPVNVLVEGEDHKVETMTGYDGTTDLPVIITNRRYNKATSEYMESIENFTYDDWGDVTGYWDAQAEIDGQSVPVDDEHKTSFEYHETYHYLTEKTYMKDAGSESREVYAPDENNGEKTVEWAEIYENDVLKEKTQYSYDEYGNVTEEKRYLDDWEDYISKNYDYADNVAGRNDLFDGVYLTRTWVGDVRDADGELTDSRNGLDPGIVDQIFEYDWFGNVVELQDGNGNNTVREYDLLGRVIQETYADNSNKTWEYTLDSSENSVEMIYENGRKTKTFYNEFGNFHKEQAYVRDTETGLFEYEDIKVVEYDAYFNITVEHNAVNGTYTEYFRQSDDRVTGIEKRDSSDTLLYEENYSYEEANSSGLYLKTTKTIAGDINSPSIITSEYTDKNGRVVRKEWEHDSGTYSETYVQDYLGNVIEKMSARANDEEWEVDWTSAYEYDYRGRVVREYDAESNFVSYAYDSLGRLTTFTDAKGNLANPAYSTSYAYDSLGRMLEILTPFEEVSSTLYYSSTKKYYDRNGNVIRELVQDNIPGAAESFRETGYGYNSRGLLVKVTAYEDGEPTTYTQYYYDASGNKLRMYTGLSSPLQINGLDDITEGSDSSYSIDSYEYDEQGNLAAYTDALGNSEVYTYDLNGNVIQKTDKNGNVTDFTNDGLDRLVLREVTTPDGDGDVAESYTYTLTGLIRSSESGGHTIIYSYDDLGRLVEETQTGGIAKEYGYDVGGNLISFTLLQSVNAVIEEEYEYDHLNRLVSMSEDGTKAAVYEYDANGNRTLLSLRDGFETSYTYNHANNLKTLVNSRNQTTYSEYAYDYYLDGNRASEEETVSDRLAEYEYDGLDRLVALTKQ
ncbi:MAG: hypothetical protein Q7J78_02335 [Clostridiales bacterium]|nr:hypothetical protein [Clostridiales bacterium]